VDADHGVMASLFPELGVDDPVPDLERWRREMVADTLIAEEQGRPVGYLYLQALRETGHVRHVVVSPEARGEGVGRALMAAAAERFRAAGAREWALNVKPDNVPAVRLYESL